MNLDKKTYALVIAVIGMLTTWGAREKNWSKRTEESLRMISTLESDKKTLLDQKTELESQIKSDSETSEEVVPVQMPNGSIAYITRKTSKTVQEAISKATSESRTQIAELTHQISELTTTKSSDEKLQIKSAPRWNVVADVDLLTATSWSAGAGMNLGSLSLSVLNPVALTFAPRAMLAIRF